jgi:hypothetical protein
LDDWVDVYGDNKFEWGWEEDEEGNKILWFLSFFSERIERDDVLLLLLLDTSGKEENLLMKMQEVIQ